MPDDPLISVLILTYNQRQFIAQAVDSVLAQKTGFNYEIVISDDHSTDGTADILLEYQKRYPVKFKININNENVGALRNAFEIAVPLCRGKYLAFLEGDDYWNDESKLERQIRFLEENGEFGLVHSDVNQFYEAKQSLIENYNAINGITIPEGHIYNELLDPEKYIIKTPSVILIKELIEKYFDFSVIREMNWVLSDLFLWLSIARFTKVKYFPEAMATYRVLRESSSNTEDFQRKLKLHKSVYEIRLFFIEKYGCPEKLEEKVQRFYMTAMAFDAIKLKDKNLLEWVKNYSKKNNIHIGIKNTALLLKIKLLNCFLK